MDHVVELDVAPNILSQLEAHETPLRIQSPQTVYYILTLEQVLTLIRPTATINREDAFRQEEIFTPGDFGLTEEDISAYLDLRRERQAYIDVSLQKPFTTDLQDRLNKAKDNSNDSSMDEELMQELETAMLQNLQAAIPKTEQ